TTQHIYPKPQQHYRNVSRNKFLLCFRPVADMEQLVLESKGGGVGRSLKKMEMKRSLSTPCLSHNSCSSTSTSPQNLLGLHRDHSPKRTFSRVMKAVLFETVLSKRVRDRKALCQDSKHSASPTKDDDQKKGIISPIHAQEIESNSMRLSSPSLSSSGPSPNNLRKALSYQELRGMMMKPTPKNKADRSGLYMFLICLTLTIFGGKLCAILLTSFCLYFLPHRREKNHNISGRKMARR
ncbi:hypothetical protein Tsubulata_011620, partial [Turnera subulata]